jgi:hypothetical protein
VQRYFIHVAFICTRMFATCGVNIALGLPEMPTFIHLDEHWNFVPFMRMNEVALQNKTPPVA